MNASAGGSQASERVGVVTPHTRPVSGAVGERAPVARRAAPGSIARLFAPNGAPPLTREERRLLRECERLADLLDTARTSLYVSLVNGDPDLCVEACRRLQSVGFLLGEQARAVS